MDSQTQDQGYLKDLYDIAPAYLLAEQAELNDRLQKKLITEAEWRIHTENLINANLIHAESTGRLSASQVESFQATLRSGLDDFVWSHSAKIATAQIAGTLAEAAGSLISIGSYLSKWEEGDYDGAAAVSIGFLAGYVVGAALGTAILPTFIVVGAGAVTSVAVEKFSDHHDVSEFLSFALMQAIDDWENDRLLES